MDENLKEFNRSEWLQNLKAGDRVIIDKLHHPDRVATVAKVTKTLIILVKDSTRFSKQRGTPIGADTWNRINLEPVTEERLKKIKHNQLARKLSNRVAWGDIPIEKLERIMEILKEE